MIHSWHSWQIKVCNIWNLISPGYLLLSKFPFLTMTTVTIFSGLLVLVLGEWGHCFKPQRRRYLHIFFLSTCIFLSFSLNIFSVSMVSQSELATYLGNLLFTYFLWLPCVKEYAAADILLVHCFTLIDDSLVSFQKGKYRTSFCFHHKKNSAIQKYYLLFDQSKFLYFECEYVLQGDKTI